MSLHVPANPGRPQGSNLYPLKVQKPSHCQSRLYFIIVKYLPSRVLDASPEIGQDWPIRVAANFNIIIPYFVL
jgi:hypothetical protein